MEEKILKIVNNTQGGCVNHMKNVKLLEKVFKSNDFDQFVQCFLKVLQGIIQEDFQNPCVQNLLNFLAKFVGHIVSAGNVEDNCSETESSPHPFLNAVLETIIPYHDYGTLECRYNTCNFLSLILQNLGEQFVVDSHIVDLILNPMLGSIQDSKPLVRLQAVIALTRLQDPPNPECPVIRAYINCLRDSSHLVRREAVKRIAPNAITIPMLKEKTRDRDANVRGAAFTHLADIGVKYLRIVHRQFILRSGFSETNPQVKKIFFEYLLPKWLSDLNGSYLALLSAIKLDADETDIINTEELSALIMQVFFKTEPISNLIDALPLDETKLVPENSIKSELAHYWNILVKYLRQSEDLEEYLDQIIPELTIFCDYIDRLVSNKFSKVMEDWEYLNFQYMLYHLFDMAENYDLSEEVGRRALDKLIKKILRNHRLQPRLLNKIVPIGSKLASDTDSFTNEICVIISDIWQPLTSQPSTQQTNTMEHNFRIAQLEVKLNILNGDLEDAVSEKNFEKAHQLNVAIQECEKKLQEMTVDTTPVEQVRVASEDPEVLCWCLDLLAALLIHGNIKTLSPSLVTCKEEFLMPLIITKNVEIGWRAFRCLTVYCIFDKKLAEDQLKTLCVPIASYRIIPNFNKEILIDSIGVVTNLVLLYDTDLFTTENGTNSTITTQNTTRRRLYNEEAEEVDYINNNRLTVDFIISVFLDMLDDESDDIRETAVTGIAKLMLNGFPITSMVMTRLILKWYNPSTQKSLQQKLGMVIKCYTEKITNAKEIVAKSVVPIVTNIAEAPRTSPLAEVDIDNAVRFLAAITDSEDRIGFVHIHTELGRILLNEISLRPSESATVYFAKMLNFLSIIPDNSPAVKELITLAELILEKETLEKSPKHHVTKFIGKLNGQTPSSTITSVNNTTNTSGNATTDQSARQLDSRRLSTVIEEDKSDDEVEAAGSNESHDGVPVKRRRIDHNDGNVEGVSNAASNMNNEGTREKQLQPVEAQSSAENNNNNNETAPKTTTNGVSSSSESDIIPSSQTGSEAVSRKTKNGAKPKEQITEKVAESHRSVGNGEKPTSGSSEQAVPSAPKPPEQTGRNTRSKANNVAVQEEVDNRAVRRSLRRMNTDQSGSSDSSNQAVSGPRVNSVIGKSTRKTVQEAQKITHDKSAVKETNGRVVGKTLRRLRSSDSSVQSTPSSASTASAQHVRKSHRKRIRTRKSLDSGTETTRSNNHEVVNRNGKNATATRRSAPSETFSNASSSFSERTDYASSTSQESARQTRKGNKATAENAKKNASSSSSSERTDYASSTTSTSQESVRQTRKGNKASSDTDKQREMSKSLRKNSSSKSDAYSSASKNSQSSTESASASSSETNNERVTRRSNAKRQESHSESKKGNARMNGVRKASEKENHILPPPAKRKLRNRLNFDSPSKNLIERHENNIFQGKELYIRINNANKSINNLSKTPQVKRKKLRKMKNRMEKSVNDVIMNASDSSVDQTLHTIVHPPDFEVSLLEEDSPENTPNRSSRRLNVVLSETSSDESPTISIRKSKRRTMKTLS